MAFTKIDTSKASVEALINQTKMDPLVSNMLRAMLRERDTIIKKRNKAEGDLVFANLSKVETKRERDRLQKALDLALQMLSSIEPGDSRAVSNEFDAIALVSCGLADRRSDSIIDNALDDASEPKCVNAHDRCYGGEGGPCPYCEVDVRRHWIKKFALANRKQLHIQYEVATQKSNKQRGFQMKNKDWIGVDLDRTLAFYDHWRGPTHIGEPIQPMVDRVKEWLAQGKHIKIFTARVADPDPHAVAEITRAIQEWCEEHIGERLEVTNVKDWFMVELWDDRAVGVYPNAGISTTQQLEIFLDGIFKDYKLSNVDSRPVNTLLNEKVAELLAEADANGYQRGFAEAIRTINERDL